MAGISIFPGMDCSLEDNLSYMQRAYKQGARLIFSSLHIPQAAPQAFDEFTALLQESVRLGMEMIVDISKAYMAKYDIASLPIAALRLDFGFSDEEIVRLTQKSRCRIQLNASALTLAQLQRLFKLGLPRERIEACHNYYPRPETGISLELFRAKNRFLKEEGLKVLAFVPAKERPRGPLHEGLPTLESHRGLPAFIGAQELLREGADEVLIGDSMASEAELALLMRAGKESYLLALELASELPPGCQSYFEGLFTNRQDPGAFCVRAEESRERALSYPALIEPVCAGQERPAYAVTVDNKGYGRYQGELQILQKAQKPDRRVNVLGSAAAGGVLIGRMRGGEQFQFVALK